MRFQTTTTNWIDHTTQQMDRINIKVLAVYVTVSIHIQARINSPRMKPAESKRITISSLGWDATFGEEQPKPFYANDIPPCKAGLEKYLIRSLLSPTDLRCLQFLTHLQQREQKARYVLMSF